MRRKSEELKTEQEIHDSLRDWCKGQHLAYMVVGFLMADSIAFSDETHSGNNLDIRASLLTQQTGAALVIPDVSPVEMGIAKDSTTSQGSKTKVVGSRIFTMEYRNVRKKIWTRSDGTGIEAYGARGDRTLGDRAAASGRAQDSQNFEMIMEDEEDITEIEE